MYEANIPGGPLAFEVGYRPRKKIHVIRVVFSVSGNVRAKFGSHDMVIYTLPSYECLKNKINRLTKLKKKKITHLSVFLHASHYGTQPSSDWFCQNASNAVL